MTFGVSLFATDYSIRPDEFARAAEERGFDSVFFPEHTHIHPAERRRSRWEANSRENIRMFTTYS